MRVLSRLARSWFARGLFSVAGVATAAVIVFRIPHLSGSTWTDMGHRLANLGTPTVLLIAGLWLAGLLAYTVAMTSSMPGLSHSRALVLNLAGSSASNALPFGGVLGTGVNLAMIRSWRLSSRSFASSAAVLNLVNLLTKLILPVIAGIVIGRSHSAAPWLGRSALAAAVVSAVVVAGLFWALSSPRWAVKADAVWDRIVARVRNTPKSAAARLQAGPATELREQVREVLRRRWLGLTFGMTGYVLLQWALFAVCLHSAGVQASFGAIFAAFAVERAVTLAVFTPAGTGLAEAAATGLLVALGSWPASAAAGVLLYRLFVFIAEIPVGAVVLGAWASSRFARRRHGVAA